MKKVLKKAVSFTATVILTLTFFTGGIFKSEVPLCFNASASSETAYFPDAPLKVSAVQNETALKLIWTEVKGADGYLIYYFSGGKWKKTANVTGTEHTFTSLSSGLKVKFAVRPYAYTLSGYTLGKSKIFTAATKPEATSLTGTTSASAITLFWSGSVGAQGYRIYYKTSLNGSWKLALSSTKNTTAVFRNLPQNKAYLFAVRPYIITDTGVVYGAYNQYVFKTKASQSDKTTVDLEKGAWNLEVVDSSRQIPYGYEPKLAYITGSYHQMDYRVAPYYNKMYEDALKDGAVLTAYSGYRSYERQKSNFESQLSDYMSDYGMSYTEAYRLTATEIMPAGCSEHNLGLAMDIVSTSSGFSDTYEYKWLKENAHKYGFIERYTAEKQHITGVIPEPWHWRYVGVKHATFIRQTGLCLEEYLLLFNVKF